MKLGKEQCHHGYRRQKQDNQTFLWRGQYNTQLIGNYFLWAAECVSLLHAFYSLSVFAFLQPLLISVGPAQSGWTEHGENQNQFPKLPFTEDSSAEPCSRYMDLFLCVHKIFPSKWDHNNNLNELWMQVPVLRRGSIVKIFVLCSCRIEEEYICVAMKVGKLHWWYYPPGWNYLVSWAFCLQICAGAGGRY